MKLLLKIIALLVLDILMAFCLWQFYVANSL